MTLEDAEKKVRVVLTPTRQQWLVMTSHGWMRTAKSMARWATYSYLRDEARMALALATCNPWQFAFEPGQPIDLPDRKMNLHNRADPLVTFIIEKCELAGEVDKAELFRAWKPWCEAGCHCVGTVAELCKRLRIDRLAAVEFAGRTIASRSSLGSV